MKTVKINRFPKLDGAGEEAMNTLCTNLSYCGSDQQVIMITSRYPMEGKTYVSINLMRTMAQMGKRVVLVDTDFRASGVSSRYGIRYPDQERHGFSDYLAGHCELEAVLYDTEFQGAAIIPSGYILPNPLHLLDSERMAEAIRFLKKAYDLVLVDTPPAGLIVDAIALGKYCDGAIIVVSHRRGRCRDIREVTQHIQKTGCKVLGAVMNNVNFRKWANRQHYYHSERYAAYHSGKYRYSYEKKKQGFHDLHMPVV